MQPEEGPYQITTGGSGPQVGRYKVGEVRENLDNVPIGIVPSRRRRMATRLWRITTRRWRMATRLKSQPDASRYVAHREDQSR